MFVKWLPLLLCSPFLFARVELTTSINNVYYRGNNELTGALTLTVVGDDFREASAADPIYIQIWLDHNTGLAETLVEQISTSPLENQPLNLALRLKGADTTVVAAPDAVSIVRWVRGEPEIWIKVQQSSDEWLNDGSPHGPSIEQAVCFTIGISARISDRANDAGNRSNLPFNTRDTTAQEGDFGLAASTLICANLSSANLLSDGTQDSALTYDALAFDDGVDLGGGVYHGSSGNILGIDFTNDFRIARGKNHQCTLQNLTQGSGSTGAGTGGLTRFGKSIDLQFLCTTGNNFLPAYLEANSYLRVEALTPGFGFEEGDNTLTIKGQPSSSSIGVSGREIDINGVALFTAIEVFWTGERTLLNDVILALDLGLQYEGASTPDDFQVRVDLALKPTPDADDSSPYNGQTQCMRCNNYWLEIPGEAVTLDPPTL